MDDLFVLLQMPLKKLSIITKKTISESVIVPHGNRVYFFAENFEVLIKLINFMSIELNWFIDPFIFHFLVFVVCKVMYALATQINIVISKSMFLQVN